MPSKVEMCEFYSIVPIDDFRRFKTVCEKGHRAGIRCHSKRLDCPDYKPSTWLSLEEVKKKYGLEAQDAH